MIHLKLGRIFNDVAHMLALFHIAFASVVVVADVGHFFVAADLVVFLPLFEIFHVFEFLPSFRSITMLLRQLPKHVLFLAHICVVWEYQHELVVVGHVIILIDYKVLLNNIQFHRLHLNHELGVLVRKEW